MVRPGEISKKAALLGVEAKQIEKDYVITWLLYGISLDELLKESLVFKGGTVLKKAYFDDYRFSEDLDFTLIHENPSDSEIESAFNSMLKRITNETAIECKLVLQNNILKNTFSFYIEYIGPLGGSFQSGRKIKVDITRNEIMEYPPELSPIFLNYSDLESIAFSIKIYSLGEILIEKMSAIMSRSQPRDLYDLWMLLTEKDLDLKDYWFSFENKARNKMLIPENFSQVLIEKESTFKKRWDLSLKHQVQDLPIFNDVFRELNKHLRRIEKFSKK